MSHPAKMPTPHDLVDDAVRADDVLTLAKHIQAYPEQLAVYACEAFQSTWLDRAASLGCLNVARWLVEEAGMSTESVDARNGTPLLTAIVSKKDAMVDLLLSLGANPNGNPEGGRPLHMAARHRPNERILKALLKQGADVNEKVCGETALMVAAENGEFENIKVLLAAGADPFIRSKGSSATTGMPKGLRAVDLAERHGQHQAAEMLHYFMLTVKARRRLSTLERSRNTSHLQPL